MAACRGSCRSRPLVLSGHPYGSLCDKPAQRTNGRNLAFWSTISEHVIESPSARAEDGYEPMTRNTKFVLTSPILGIGIRYYAVFRESRPDRLRSKKLGVFVLAKVEGYFYGNRRHRNFQRSRRYAGRSNRVPQRAGWQGQSTGGTGCDRSGGRTPARRSCDRRAGERCRDRAPDAAHAGDGHRRCFERGAPARRRVDRENQGRRYRYRFGTAGRLDDHHSQCRVEGSDLRDRRRRNSARNARGGAWRKRHQRCSGSGRQHQCRFEPEQRRRLLRRKRRHRPGWPRHRSAAADIPSVSGARGDRASSLHA
ncbi:hypothetical protein BHMPCIPO_03729 [Ensifer sesbaniae]|nr:hypothetical protein [Ensifer sesbaniae]